MAASSKPSEPSKSKSKTFTNLNVPQIMDDVDRSPERNDTITDGIAECKIDKSIEEYRYDNSAYYCRLSQVPMQEGKRVIRSSYFGPCFPILMYQKVGQEIKGGFVHMFVAEDKWEKSIEAVMRTINMKGKLTINIYSRLTIEEYDKQPEEPLPHDVLEDKIKSMNANQTNGIKKLAAWFKNEGYKPINIFRVSASNPEVDTCEIDLRYPDRITWSKEL